MDKLDVFCLVASFILTGLGGYFAGLDDSEKRSEYDRKMSSRAKFVLGCMILVPFLLVYALRSVEIYP